MNPMTLLSSAKLNQSLGKPLSAEEASTLAAYNAQVAQNAQYMGYSLRQPNPGDAQNSTSFMVGNSPNRSNWYAPTIADYCDEIEIKCSLAVDYTANATSPVISLNAGAPWNSIYSVTITYGNPILQVNPYLFTIAAMMQGKLAMPPGQIISGGYVDADVQAMMYTTPTINAGTNNWLFSIRIPMTMLHPELVNGLIPLGGTGTKLEVSIQSNPSFVGVDPLNNVISTNGTIAVTGTYSVTFWTRGADSPSFTNAVGPQVITPYLYPYPMIIQPASLNPLTAGSKMGKTLSIPYQVFKLINIVIDGNQSDKFASASNLQAFELDKADSDKAVLFRYDLTDSSASEPMTNYFRKIRDNYHQDLPPGVLVYDPIVENVVNADNLNGDAYLNLTASGYPAARQRFQVGSVGAISGITPRVETFAYILNDAGLYVKGA